MSYCLNDKKVSRLSQLVQDSVDLFTNENNNNTTTTTTITNNNNNKIDNNNYQINTSYRSNSSVGNRGYIKSNSYTQTNRYMDNEGNISISNNNQDIDKSLTNVDNTKLYLQILNEIYVIAQAHPQILG